MVYIFVSLNEDFMHSVAQNLISLFYFPIFCFSFVFEVRGTNSRVAIHTFVLHYCLLVSNASVLWKVVKKLCMKCVFKKPSVFIALDPYTECRTTKVAW